MINEKLFFFVVLLSVCLLLPRPAFAESSYVLPYPSYMPGSMLYRPHLFLEVLEKFWYFGTFGQFSYNLSQSDKYLVEAKTLFEYKQYVFALRSLEKSDTFFVAVSHSLQKANNEKKDITQKERLFKEAALKHKEVLSNVKQDVPSTFLWQPEKQNSSTLYLWQTIDKSLSIRENCI